MVCYSFIRQNTIPTNSFGILVGRPPNVQARIFGKEERCQQSSLRLHVSMLSFSTCVSIHSESIAICSLIFSHTGETASRNGPVYTQGAHARKSGHDSTT